MKKTLQLFTDPIERFGFFALVIGHFIAAYFSFGFHHPDEHFQILEFANVWAFHLSPDSLPWEYAARIRPWFQPLLHAIPMRLLSAINAYEPVYLALLFRMLYAALNIYTILKLWHWAKVKVSAHPIVFGLVSTLWFLPYIHARTSSENLSGIFVTLALLKFLTSKEFFKIGLLFGFAFLARYQIALGLAGFGCALLYQDKSLRASHLKIFAGFLIPVALGVVLDRIGYGEWVFTAYRYFKINLVDGVAATFNPYPWYQYFIWLLELNPFVSIPLCAGVVLYYKKENLTPLTAFVFSFFFLHLFITNKEYRFLFPIFNVAIFMAALGLAPQLKNCMHRRLIVSGWIGVNLIAFLISSTHGASIHTLWCIHAAHRFSEPNEVWLSNRNYMDPFSQGYYKINHHELKLFQSGKQLESFLVEAPSSKVLIDGYFHDPITQEMISVVETKNCELLDTAQFRFLFKLRKWIPAVDRLTYKAVYQCK